MLTTAEHQGILITMTQVTFNLPEEFLPTLTETKVRMEQDMADLGDTVTEDKAGKAEFVRALRIGDNTTDIKDAEAFGTALGKSSMIAKLLMEQGYVEMSPEDESKFALVDEIVSNIAQACWATYDNEKKVKLVAVTLSMIPYRTVIRTFIERYSVSEEEIKELVDEAVVWMDQEEERYVGLASEVEDALSGVMEA